MNLNEAYEFLNFWINKTFGYYYSPEELDLIVDRGSQKLFDTLQPIYATSQRIKDALSPFRGSYSFGPSESVNGLIQIPSNLNYLSLLDLSINYAISARGITKYVPVELPNEDERADRLNSQVDPVTATSPIGEMIGKGQIQLYPEVQYNGKITFLRKPVKPYFAYTLISGRVISYDPVNSVQLEWAENWQNEVLVRALSSVGINIGVAEVVQWAESNIQQSVNTNNKN